MNSANAFNIATSNGKTKVLVIDDERIISETLVKIFSTAGYEARGVHSAEDALALLEVEGWIPHLAIVDVHLPGMNGIELAITMKARYPRGQVCLFSGWGATAELLEKAKQDGHHFEVVAKPVHPTILLGMAARVMGNVGRNIDAD
jgi:DNA-binding NtrC family response regulator